MNTSTRNITAFVFVLGAGIFFLRPERATRLHPNLSPMPLPLTAKGPGARTNALRSPALASAGSVQRPTKGPPSGPDSERQSLQAQLRAEKLCYQSETCDFPKTDPRSYGIALGHKIAGGLKEFNQKFGKSNPDEARALANDFLSNEDGFVQDAALDILHDLPPSNDSLKSVAQAVTETTDPGIVHDAMNELTRYLGTGEEGEVHQALGTLLSGGGMLAAQAASQGMLPFVNPRSVEYYQKILNTLPPASEVARNLRTTLMEYRRMSTGG